jgi:hypothetical protein
VIVPGWYDDGNGRARWWDGERWTEQTQAPQAAPRGGSVSRTQVPAAVQRFEYKVELIRETLIGDKIKTDKLEALLNRFASQGWAVKAVTSASVAGRVGGNTDGLLVTFERPIG